VPNSELERGASISSVIVTTRWPSPQQKQERYGKEIPSPNSAAEFFVDDQTHQHLHHSKLFSTKGNVTIKGQVLAALKKRVAIELQKTDLLQEEEEVKRRSIYRYNKKGNWRE